MTAQILDGKALAKTIRTELKVKVSAFQSSTGIQPGLAVILVGDNPASKVYVRNKGKACEEVGMKSVQHNLVASTSEDDLLALIDTLNQDESIHGILVQLPLPGHINQHVVLERILPQKDVDGFHPVNVGLLSIGKDCLMPCTPFGVIEILKRANIEISGKQAVVIGRSNIVGKPMAQLLLRENATVTVCHSRTADLPAECRRADILIAATGQSKMVKAGWVKPGAAVIDVGISFEERDGKYKQVGDVDKDEVMETAAYLSPSPGGPGPMTIAMLLCNTFKATQTSHSS